MNNEDLCLLESKLIELRYENRREFLEVSKFIDMLTDSDFNAFIKLSTRSLELSEEYDSLNNMIKAVRARIGGAL